MGQWCYIKSVDPNDIKGVQKQAKKSSSKESPFQNRTMVRNPFKDEMVAVDTVIPEKEQTEKEYNALMTFWNDLHYYFSRKGTIDTFPNNFLCGGTPLENIEDFEGDFVMLPRFFNLEETKEISQFLDQCAPDDYFAGFKQYKKAVQHLLALRKFFQEAVEDGRAVIISCL